MVYIHFVAVVLHSQPAYTSCPANGLISYCYQNGYGCMASFENHKAAIRSPASPTLPERLSEIGKVETRSSILGTKAWRSLS